MQSIKLNTIKTQYGKIKNFYSWTSETTLVGLLCFIQIRPGLSIQQSWASLLHRCVQATVESRGITEHATLQDNTLCDSDGTFTRTSRSPLEPTSLYVCVRFSGALIGLCIDFFRRSYSIPGRCRLSVACSVTPPNVRLCGLNAGVVYCKHHGPWGLHRQHGRTVIL